MKRPDSATSKLNLYRSAEFVNQQNVFVSASTFNVAIKPRHLGFPGGKKAILALTKALFCTETACLRRLEGWTDKETVVISLYR